MSATEAAVETWVLVASVAIEVIVGRVWLPGVAAIEVIEDRRGGRTPARLPSGFRLFARA